MAIKKQVEDVEKAFESLRAEYVQKKITDKEFRARLRDLRIEDQEGRCWTIGARTGKWYYFDGKNWIESQPPSLAEGKAICIHCGYENDLDVRECTVCGGGVDESDDVMEKTAFTIDTPAEELPPFVASPPDDGTEEILAHEEVESSVLEPDTRIAMPALQEEALQLRALQAIDVLSSALFWGILGLIAGVIAGVLTGTTEFFPGISSALPSFLEAIRGQLLRGLVFGLLGAGAGFLAAAAAGALLALLINMILYFTGGLKIKMKSLSGPIEK